MLRVAAHVAMVLLALFFLANAALAWLLFDFGSRDEPAAWRQPLGAALVVAGLVAGAALLAVGRPREWSGLAAAGAVAAGAGAACIPLGPL